MNNLPQTWFVQVLDTQNPMEKKENETHCGVMQLITTTWLGLVGSCVT